MDEADCEFDVAEVELVGCGLEEDEDDPEV